MSITMFITLYDMFKLIHETEEYLVVIGLLEKD